jgi:hypothetical protein
MKIIDAPLLPLLKEGLEEQQIVKQLKSIGVTFPQDAIDLYKWHNGTNFQKRSNASQSLFFRGLFPDFERAVCAFHYYSKHDKAFQKRYFMLFETVGGEMFLINCDQKSVEYGMIYKYDISRAVSSKIITTMYDSLACFLETIIECYRRKIYKIVKHEEPGELLLDSDWVAEARLSRAMNPRSAYWKFFRE